MVGILAEPGKPARRVEGDGLEWMQSCVDGYVEHIGGSVPGDGDVDLWVNEEFLLRDDCEPNRRLPDGTAVYGPMLFLGIDWGTGESVSLTERQAAMVMAAYGEPQEVDGPKPSPTVTIFAW